MLGWDFFLELPTQTGLWQEKLTARPAGDQY